MTNMPMNLVPNDDGNDPLVQAAVLAHIKRLAQQAGIEVNEPGEIDPTAKENPERAADFRENINPQLIEASREYEQYEHIEEEQTSDGRIRRRIERIMRADTRLSISLKGLNELLDRFSSGAIAFGGKFVKWSRVLVPSRRRK